MLFLFSKMTIYYLIYRPLKYKDDGRDVVNWIDFVTIHMTFPAINAWISYQMYYAILTTVTTICGTEFVFDLDLNLCHNYEKTSAHDKYYFFYKSLMPASQIAFSMLFIEATINITYYKDCVFAVCVFATYIGMLWVNWIYRKKFSD